MPSKCELNAPTLCRLVSSLRGGQRCLYDTFQTLVCGRLNWTILNFVLRLWSTTSGLVDYRSSWTAATPISENSWPGTRVMAHRHVCTRRVLEQFRLFCPRNQKVLLRSVVAKNIALAASPERIQQPCDGDPHPSVMKELRSHFSKSGILTNIGIIDVLRKWHPDHTITQTPKSTGILKLAKAGYADAMSSLMNIANVIDDLASSEPPQRLSLPQVIAPLWKPRGLGRCQSQSPESGGWCSYH